MCLVHSQAWTVENLSSAPFLSNNTLPALPPEAFCAPSLASPFSRCPPFLPRLAGLCRPPTPVSQTPLSSRSTSPWTEPLSLPLGPFGAGLEAGAGVREAPGRDISGEPLRPVLPRSHGNI